MAPPICLGPALRSSRTASSGCCSTVAVCLGRCSSASYFSDSFGRIGSCSGPARDWMTSSSPGDRFQAPCPSVLPRGIGAVAAAEFLRQLRDGRAAAMVGADEPTVARNGKLPSTAAAGCSWPGAWRVRAVRAPPSGFPRRRPRLARSPPRGARRGRGAGRHAPGGGRRFQVPHLPAETPEPDGLLENDRPARDGGKNEPIMTA